jgi:hypothetical protein
MYSISARTSAPKLTQFISPLSALKIWGRTSRLVLRRIGPIRVICSALTGLKIFSLFPCEPTGKRQAPPFRGNDKILAQHSRSALQW